MDPRLRENEVKKLRSPPAEGKRNVTFSPNFTQPGAHLLEHPCAVFYHFCTGHATHVFLKVVAGPFILHLIDGHPSRIVHFGFIIVQLYLLAIKETVGLCKK